jgi:hypothetical protein
MINLRWFLEVTILVENSIPDPERYPGTKNTEQSDQLREVELQCQAVAKYADHISAEDSFISPSSTETANCRLT